MAGPQVGDVLAGKYRILEGLASGAMGVIYLAEHVTLRRRVAIKVLRPELCEDPDLASRFEQEARAASSIGDPRIVEVFDLGRTADGSLYMVMELLQGRALAEILAEDPLLPLARAVDLVAQTLSALAAAHKHHIVHRDLKPENIFVIETEARPNFVKLLDFGISKVLAGGAARQQRPTVDGTLLGTPEYMAPELARGEVGTVDARADIYAAGVVLYECLCGRTPYQGPNYNAIISNILNGDYISPAALRSDIPPALAEVIRTALSRDRNQRFPTALVMRDKLLAAAVVQPPKRADAGPVIHLPLTVEEPEPLPPEVYAAPMELPYERELSAPAIMINSRSSAYPKPPRVGTLARPHKRTWIVTWPSLRLAAYALLGVVAVGLGIRYLRRGTTQPHEAPFVIDVSPDDATLMVDGKLIDGHGLTLTAGDHVVEARAPGFVARRVAFHTGAEPGQVSVRLGHQLVPLAARDLMPLALAPQLPADVNAIFNKLDGFAVCIGASNEVYRIKERLPPRTAAAPAVIFDPDPLDACTELGDHEHLPALPDLDAAAREFIRVVHEIPPLFYMPTSDPLAAKLRDFVNIDENFRRELRGARVANEKAELAILGAEGHSTAWLMRRAALAAEAWGVLSIPTPATLAALDESAAEVHDRLARHAEAGRNIQGSAKFTAAIDALVALAHASPPRTRAEAMEAVNRVIDAFDGMVTD